MKGGSEMGKRKKEDFHSPAELEILKFNPSESNLLSNITFHYGLCKQFLYCSNCQKLNPNSKKLCCEKGCYLETLGITIDSMSKESKQVLMEYLHGLSHLFLLLADNVITSETLKEQERQQKEQELNLYNWECDLEKKKDELLKEKATLQKEKSNLKKSLSEFERKKQNLGRKSNLMNRKEDYLFKWKLVNPKPTYQELAKMLHISVSQVYLDLKELGYIEKRGKK